MKNAKPCIISVGSCKGGVGKSTCALLSALALTRSYAVGLVDADLYGSSLLDICGIHGEESRTLKPISAGALDILSLAPLKEKHTPLAWRAPLLHKALLSMLQKEHWTHKDVVIVDLPPGTGDIALTLMQNTPLLGHIMVTTPHTLAVRESLLFTNLCTKMRVPLLGTLLNMYDLHEESTEMQGLQTASPVIARIPYTRSLSKHMCSSHFLSFCESHMTQTLQSIHAHITQALKQPSP